MCAYLYILNLPVLEDYKYSVYEMAYMDRTSVNSKFIINL